MEVHGQPSNICNPESHLCFVSYRSFWGDGLGLHQGHEDQRGYVHPESWTALAKDKILYISLERGWREGTVITFPEHRDAKTDDFPTKIAFPLKQVPQAFSV